MELTSRPGLLGIDVDAWGWRRDLAWLSRRSRLGSDLSTWPRQGLGQFGVATWGKLPALFCLLCGHSSWALFMDTIHEHCSQGFEIKK